MSGMLIAATAIAADGNVTVPALTAKPFDAVSVDETVSVPVTDELPVTAMPPALIVNGPVETVTAALKVAAALKVTAPAAIARKVYCRKLIILIAPAICS